MSLIKSISGIRGTIGGVSGENLTPIDVVKFTAAYAKWIISTTPEPTSIVVGRDARISGPLVANLVLSTLTAMGLDVIDLGLSTTPTVEMKVMHSNASGGIIITASHNPKEWNALKLLNGKGEFISKEARLEILKYADEEDFSFIDVEHIGKIDQDENALEAHLKAICELAHVNTDAIAEAGFSVAFDAVNSSGGIAIPALLKTLGVKTIHPLNGEPTGVFAHNPEPLPAHLKEIMDHVNASDADVGFVVDPDVDRLAIVCEDGSYFGEEYTLVAIADYILSKEASDTVSNLSSSRALRDVTRKHGNQHHYAAVGEVNVVNKMKDVAAKIGGEGNGGIIYPELHYGRDALVGIALFLSLMAERKLSVSDLRSSYPSYHMEKEKIKLDAGVDLDQILNQLKTAYENEDLNTIDGLKIDFENCWVHLRKSNTEPIIRIYAEHADKQECKLLVDKFLTEIKSLLRG